MIGFILLPLILITIYLLINIIKRYFKLINLNNKLLNIFIYVFLYFGIFITTLAFFIEPSYIKNIFNRIGYLFIGFELYFVLSFIVIFAIYYFISKHNNSLKNNKYIKYLPLIISVLFTISFSLYGVYNAHDLKVVKYDINVNKDSNINSLNVVLLSDLHLGYNVGLKEISEVVSEINANKPDVVLIAGDLFDNDFDSIYNPDEISNTLAKIKSKYGVYTTLGNHDVNEKIYLGFTFSWLNKSNPSINNEMKDFIDESNINILYDDFITIGDIQIYGRPDKVKINFNNNNRLDANEVLNKLDSTKPIIIVDHEPTDYELYKDMNVDLYLCGHTHDGQLFPLNLTSKLTWDNSSGYKKYENMHNIVTSGVGLYGIDMRTFTNAEICNILINFN